ncbi:hypothetical protein GCM10009037_07190 [Halarchaeum grantii]|uniref:Uncharacterized protein n=1 Tax=Halarchaeum grantii TaxID=1193105 RepID=A0A830FA56_9EURY|nr:hypothetical protein [Halarchaeum grantii]GGL26124.1 hypothetical protein GCM10009037_07190 [Halarchaeum grantii]
MTEHDGTRSRRPAEVQVVTQLSAERDQLLEGFTSRRAVIRWGQRVAVRTLGQVPQDRYRQLARSFKPDNNAQEGVLLAAFLRSGARTRDLDDEVARGLRERWAADVLGTVSVRAFRSIRKDAGEYIGDSEDDGSSDVGYDPASQSFAMRPALSELDDVQADTLGMLLGGLEDRRQILDWGDYLTSATRGEPVDPDLGTGAFVPKCYRESSTVRALTDPGEEYERFREMFAAKWLLPAFNRGVRDLTNRTAEEPDGGDDSGPAEAPSW